MIIILETGFPDGSVRWGAYTVEIRPRGFLLRDKVNSVPIAASTMEWRGGSVAGNKQFANATHLSIML
jgi:hypothetical protein